jgi:hypothetical protein
MQTNVCNKSYADTILELTAKFLADPARKKRDTKSVEEAGCKKRSWLVVGFSFYY